jgi:hypothetical protein
VGLLDLVAEYDGAPTTQAARAAAASERALADLLRQLEALRR